MATSDNQWNRMTRIGGHSLRVPNVAWTAAMAIVCFAPLTGCQENNLGATVTGTVTLDGKPVGPGTVMFVPVDRQATPSLGTIDVNGRYFLKTSREEGVVPGTYQVTATVREHPPLAPGERAPDGSSKLITPEKYARTETSGLEVTVEAGKNRFDIELTSE